MILCEQPWYNEPGREHRANAYMAKHYNNEVRAWTLMHAILPWAESVHADNGVLSEIAPTNVNTTPFWHLTVRLYLRIHAVDIVQATQEAISGLLGGTDGPGLSRALAQVMDAFRAQRYTL